jgi:hypothetical protein
MLPFSSAAEMLHTHELMFGEAGRQCAEVVVRLADTLFATPLNALNIRVVLAPVELGPYNRHAGYHYGGGSDGDGTFILGNRHIVKLSGGSLKLKGDDTADDYLRGMESFIVHELTHARQRQLQRQHGGDKRYLMKRGAHRDHGWYEAISEACPRYLGVEFPRSAWPAGPRSGAHQGRLTEVEVTHWPSSFCGLIDRGDPRLMPRSAMLECA